MEKLKSVATSEDIPLEVIKYVAITEEYLLLNDAKGDQIFESDYYIKKNQPKSILCLPIGGQGKLMGIIYLENNLTDSALTADRVQFLTMLTTQAAIALENAKLYQQLEEYSHSLEDEVEERTRELKAAQKQIVTQEKLASLGALTAGIAHEIRNPLNFVNGFAEISEELVKELTAEIESISKDIDADKLEEIEALLNELKGNMIDINEQGKRADGIIQSMLSHSRESSGERELTDINAVLGESIKLVYHGFSAKDKIFNMTIETDYDRDMPEIEVVRSDVSRSFLNIINNACYAANAKKKAADFTPQLKVKTSNLGSAVEIRIRDNGTGIPPTIQEKIFHPFFTTKPTGEGTGLGLSLAHDIIVGQHQGEILLETEPGVYTEFIIRFPRD
ncbi:MAG: GAF domain-containing protein [Hormoscilla sp. GM7CHS1pb]|nr:GAF domain-containing protein [Hormoscilla sp. GM7CHS1pb]